MNNTPELNISSDYKEDRINNDNIKLNNQGSHDTLKSYFISRGGSLSSFTE